MNTKTFSTREDISDCRAFLKPLSNPGSPIVKVGSMLSLGRSPSSKLHLKDPYISNRHCRIEHKAGKYYIFDLRSKNGTYVNGNPVVEAPLKDLDRISIGHHRFVFSLKYDCNFSKLKSSSKNNSWNQKLIDLESIARSPFPVLVTGPSGSGKEIIAQEIHSLSNRQDEKIICVNCSAFNENLIESELFGHQKGSFTGAHIDRMGAFEAARGGTLFLDEIGDLPMSLQPKLLRALEASEIRPVGGDHSIKTDVRIIAATHRNLIERVEQEEFREDLFFRINVLSIDVPALNQRKEDITDLIYYYAQEFRVSFSQEAIKHLAAHDWPGNIRELKNFIAKCSVHFKGQEICRSKSQYLLDNSGLNHLKKKKNSKIKSVEKNLIEQALFLNNGNQRRASEQLGMPKSTLNDKIKAYSINIKYIANKL